MSARPSSTPDEPTRAGVSALLVETLRELRLAHQREDDLRAALHASLAVAHGQHAEVVRLRARLGAALDELRALRPSSRREAA